MVEYINNSPNFPANAKILITGGTGFIGSALVFELIRRGAEVWVLSRRANEYRDKHNLHHIESLSVLNDDQRIDVIINLAGQNLGEKRWSKQLKEEFINSRVNTTRDLVALMSRLKRKPECFISGSAIGYYGPNNDDILDEESGYVPCYSHDLCDRWEKEADACNELDIRVCKIRIGVVFGKGGGPFEELRKSFDMGVASQIGDGKHWMSWVHLEDVLQGIVFLIENKQLSGTFNFTAPQPVRYSTFTHEYKQIKKSLLKVNVPSFMMKMLVGEMADEVLLTGQRVVPNRLLKAGYEFTFNSVDKAIRDLA